MTARDLFSAGMGLMAKELPRQKDSRDKGMITTIETQNRAQIMSMITNGVPMYASVMDSDVQRIHPIVIDSTILIPVSYKGFTWIERLGKNPKENISSVISIFFQWETGKKEMSIGELLEQELEAPEEDINFEEEED